MSSTVAKQPGSVNPSPETQAPAIHGALAEFIERTEHALDSMGLHDIVTPFYQAGWNSIPIDLLTAHRNAQHHLDIARYETEAFLQQLKAAVEGKGENRNASTVTDVIQARKFELLDDEGRVRAALEMRGTGTPRSVKTPDLIFYDRSESPKVSLGLMHWDGDDHRNEELGCLDFSPPAHQFGSKMILSAEPDGSLDLSFNDESFIHVMPDGRLEGLALQRGRP